MIDRAKWIVSFALFFASMASCAPDEQGEASSEARAAQQLAIDWMKGQYPERDSFEVKEFYHDAEAEQSSNYGFEFANGGFAIVGVGDEGMSVLAYANEDGLFAEDEEESALVSELIGNLKLQAKGAQTLHAAQVNTVVEPLIKSTWGQSGGIHPNYTYNKYTPLVSSKERAPVGCVAVAFGQVMNYYQFPQRGIGVNRYCSTGKPAYSCSDGTVVEADFRTGYDWMSMPTKLSYSSSSTQVDAVSKLLYHVGIAVNAKYAAGGTSAQISNPTVFNGFRKHFKMTEVKKVNKSDYTDGAWEELIKAEIVNGRPVVLFGEDAKLGAGHAYILDGIDKNGFVHVNWGWNGSANGYFKLGSLVVDGKYSFTDDLSAYINFVPPVRTVVKNYELTLKPGEWVGVAPVPGTNDYGFNTVDDIRIEMNYSGRWRGDADLYVKKGSPPANADDFDCAPKKGSSIESCYLKGRGKYFIKINGYNEHGQKSESPITLKVTYKEYAE